MYFIVLYVMYAYNSDFTMLHIFHVNDLVKHVIPLGESYFTYEHCLCGCKLILFIYFLFSAIFLLF